MNDDEFSFGPEPDDDFEPESMRTMRAGGTDPAAGLLLGRIDQYDLVRKLGGGGFGVVYLAKDTVSGIDVAIKTLHPMLKSNAEELENVRANFKLVASLYHPNVAAALSLHVAETVEIDDPAASRDLKMSPGDAMMVMAYAPGVPLSKWRRQFPGGVVPLDLVLEIGRQMASALDYAHGERIVHRDVKPANVMVETTDDGRCRIRILDFGLAAEIRSSMGRMSQEKGDTSGTRPYMAPEQWLGRRQDGRTDQYAFACVLYELLSGEPPFGGVFQTGDPLVMMNAVENRTPDPVEGLDASRNAALAKALAKKPSDRYETCMELVDELRKGTASSVPTPSSAEEVDSFILLSATAGETEVSGAVLSVWGQTVNLPAKLQIDYGSTFGPGEVSFTDERGIRFEGRFDGVPVDWRGVKTLSVPLHASTPVGVSTSSFSLLEAVAKTGPRWNYVRFDAFLLAFAVPFAIAGFMTFGAGLLLLWGCFVFGWAGMSLRAADRRKIEFSDMFAGLNQFGRAFCCWFLRAFFCLLWSLLFVVPGIVKGLAWWMTPFVLLDHPGIGVPAAMRESARIMDGNKWKFVCFQFHYLGWWILSVATLGLGFFWLVPYQSVATAAFYRAIAKEKERARR